MEYKDELLGRIKNLERDEHDSIAKIEDVASKKGASISRNQRIYAKYCLVTDKYSNVDLFPDKTDAYWTNAVDKIPLFRQLLHKNHLIVDFKPFINNQQCIELYGFSVNQLLSLATSKLITLNMYAYESNKKINFADYTLFTGSREEKEDYANLFLQENNIRINSIRRSHLFEKIFNQDDISHSDSILEGQEKFKFIIDSRQLIEELKRKKIIREDSAPDGVLHQLSQHYAETKSFLSVTNNVKGQELLHSLGESISDPFNIIAILRALRVMFASPLSASLGGDYTMSASSLSSVEHARSFLRNESATIFQNLNESSISYSDTRSVKKVIRDFISHSLLEKYNLNHVPINVSNTLFEDYKHFLIDHKLLIAKQAKFIDNIAKGDIYQTEHNLDKLEFYLKSQDDLSKEIATIQKISSVTWKSVITVGAAYLFTKPEAEMLTTILAVDLVKDLYESFFAEAITKNRSQLMLDDEDVKKWIKQYD